MTTYGLLGFGEVARHFAAGVEREDDDRWLAYDRAFEEGADRADAARVRERMVGLEVEPARHVHDLAACELILSVVAPASALSAARAFAPSARPGQAFVDLNSTAPGVKHAIAELLEPLGVTVVDGAMTGGGVSLDGHRIPISLAGPAAPTVAATFARLGLVAAVVGDEIGQAAAMKMLRGVVIKGLEALSVEAFTAARLYGIEHLVLDSISESLDRWPIRDFITMLVTTHTRYCGRRSDEVEMIRATVEDAGVDPVMSTAASRLFERSVASDLRIEDRSPEDFEESIDVLRRSLPPSPGTRGDQRG